MDLPIFFIDTPANTNILTLGEDTSKHIVQVLRMKPLERLQLTDGAGRLLTAEIVDDHKKRCTVKIIESKTMPQRDQKVCVAISLLKNNSRFEWFLEKATEIGVAEIIPLLCERTEKQHFRTERMRQIIVSAMMQSKQTWLPVLHEPVSVPKMIESSAFETKLIAHCEDDTKLFLADFRKQQNVQVLIGPEGDFSREEIDLAFSKNYKPVSLGDTRLRAETAGVVAATLLCI